LWQIAVMGNYWRKVFARAWADTKQSFGWNQKTAIIVLTAVVGLAVTYFQSGSIAAIASATGLFWTGLATVAAALVIFLWNFFSIPPTLDTELNKKIAGLESKLANLEQPPPNYAAIRNIDRLTLREAAFYWCDLPVGRGWMPSNVLDWYKALVAAVRSGELDFVPDHSGYRDYDREREHRKSRPHLGTVVTRSALQAFAKRHGYDPKFLRDA
jgi:hypothetical protein